MSGETPRRSADSDEEFGRLIMAIGGVFLLGAVTTAGWAWLRPQLQPVWASAHAAGMGWWAAARDWAMAARPWLPVVVVVWVGLLVVRVWRRRQRSHRRRLAEELAHALAAVTGGDPAATVTVARWRWWRVTPKRVIITHPPAWPADQPGHRTAVTDTLARVAAARYELVKQHQRKRQLRYAWRPEPDTPADRLTPTQRAALDRLTRMFTATGVFGATAQVQVTEWTQELPTAVRVRYEPDLRRTRREWRSMIEAAVGEALPGRWRGDWHGAGDLVEFRVKPGLPDRVHYPIGQPQQVFGDRFVLSYALDEFGDLHAWDPARQAHALVIGPTGGGKTTALRAIALEAVLRGAEVFGCDPKRIELMGLVGYPSVSAIATEPEEMGELIGKVSELMDARYTQIQTDPAARSRLRPIVFILDEYFILTKRLNRWWTSQGNKGQHPAIGLMEELAALARSARIHLIVGIQRPDAKFLDGAARDNYRHRIALTRLSPVGSGMLWGMQDVGLDLPTQPGRGMATDRDGEPREIQVFDLPDPDPRLTRRLTESDRQILAALRPAGPTPPASLVLHTVAEKAMHAATHPDGDRPVPAGTGTSADPPAQVRLEATVDPTGDIPPAPPVTELVAGDELVVGDQLLLDHPDQPGTEVICQITALDSDPTDADGGEENDPDLLRIGYRVLPDGPAAELEIGDDTALPRLQPAPAPAA